MAKNKKKRIGVVYSTNDNYRYDYEQKDEQETLPSEEQRLYISLDKKQRAGKKGTLIEGFIGSQEDLSNLGKQLKQHCGTGGSAKDGAILVQGDNRDRCVQFLEKLGYQCKRKGG